MRRSLAVAAVIVPLALLLSACGGGSDPASSSGSASQNASASGPAANSELLDGVKITAGETGKVPTVEFPKPLNITKTAMKLINQGDGEAVAAGQQVVLRSVALKAEDGSALGDNYAEKTGTTLLLDDQFKSQAALPYSIFVGAKIGADIAYGLPAQPASQGAQASPSALVVYHIESAQAAPPLPTLAPADEVKQLDSAGKLPAVAFDDKGLPSITIPAVDPPSNLVVKVLKEGTGEVLKSTDSANVDYSGWTWSDSKQFDSNYGKGSPFKVDLSGGVIKGWLMGLVDQKVGSTVLLTIPAALAYGDDASSGKPAGTLVFVVNIQAKA